VHPALVGLQKEKQVSDKLKEKVVGTSTPAPAGAKDGAKDAVKQTAAKGGTTTSGAKDLSPTGAKD